MWVIPVKFDPERPVVFECIEAIQRHHDKPQILVVDAGSDDQSYFDWCMERGVKIASINNQLYATGAHAWAQRHYPEVDFFYMIFDSLIVQSNCDEFRNRPLTVVRHWHSSQHDWGWDADGTHLSVWGNEQLDRMGIPRTNDYTGIMGPMMFVDRSVLEKLDHIGYWFTQVTSSYLHCAQERVAGITLEHLGHDIASVSLQGTHITHESPYDETYVAKRNMGRA